MGSGFRWCRFAQPPATIWHPFGIFLETVLAMGCAAWGHAAYRWMAMGRAPREGTRPTDGAMRFCRPGPRPGARGMLHRRRRMGTRATEGGVRRAHALAPLEGTQPRFREGMGVGVGLTMG